MAENINLEEIAEKNPRVTTCCRPGRKRLSGWRRSKTCGTGFLPRLQAARRAGVFSHDRAGITSSLQLACY